ncbi:hypothetical protein JCM8208_004319 [Rhodotorula glutinis]
MAQPVLVAGPTGWTWSAPVAVEHASSFSLAADYNVSFSCTFDMQIGDPALKKTIALPQAPVRGDWHLYIWRDGNAVSFDLQHGPLVPGALGTDLVVDIALERYQDGAFVVVAQRTSPCPSVPYIEPLRQSCTVGFGLTVPPTLVGDDPAQHSQYRFLCKLYRPGLQPRAQPVEQAFVPYAEEPGAKVAKQLAQISPDVHTLAQPHDVRIFFPHLCNYGPFELWTSESLLVASSTYFKNLFASDDAPSMIDVKAFEDSDDETDMLGEMSLDPVTISGTHAACYTTWRAVLLYLQTGHIEFAPLLSSFNGTDNPAERRNEALEAIHDENPRLPYLSSPKSVYRLAQALGLSSLSSLATCTLYHEILTLDTAPVELFSNLSRDDWLWRVTVISWLVKHWDDVKGTEAWTETMRRVSEGEIKDAGPAMVEVLEAVGKRNNVKP